MERRGGCCIARYSGEQEVACKIDRIMLRFRPIAPKPAVAGSAAQPSATETAASSRSGRKRRGAGGGGRGRKSKKEDRSPPLPAPQAEIVTLPLMPETPERKESAGAAATACLGSTPSSPPPELAPPYVPLGWPAAGMASGAVVAPRPVRPAGSWVTVECVTGELAGGGWRSEVEVTREAETDNCPVFISDELDRVTWTNEAYKRMIVGSSAEVAAEEEVRVALATRGMVPAASDAFTCHVRVKYACRKGKGTLAAPCDVWRLAEGGLAWRLDVAAALSLGLAR